MRLTGEAVTSTNSGQSYSDTYSYDLVGNRLSKTDVVGSTTTVTTDTFNNNDQLTSEAGTVNNVSSWSTSFSYDTNGSLTNVTRTGSGAESDIYGYDLQHRLSSATITRTEQGQSISISATYLYDDSGYRAYGSVTVNNGTPTNTNYLTDAMNPTGYTQVLEEHVGGSSTPSMSYIIGLAVVAQTNSTGSTSYLMPDALGSTRLVVDPIGTITVRYQYDAYGNVLGVALGVLSPPATEILYTGQFFIVATLQYYLRARTYMPMTARFTTMDSLTSDFTLCCSPWSFLREIFERRSIAERSSDHVLWQRAVASNVKVRVCTAGPVRIKSNCNS
jgi:RHS repeat-associated protein